MIIEEHVGIFENALSLETCQYYIDYFEKAKSVNQTFSRQPEFKKTDKDDNLLPIQYDWDMLIKKHEPHSREAMVSLGEKYREYTSVYSILEEGTAQHSVYHMQMQKTSIGGGYHIWHHERDCRELSNRFVAFMFYLNDVHEGGETEFLYQHKRYKPETGKLLIWPSTYTHTHRGNPPLSNDKYIITGWLEF
jgi:hypothetical protein